MNPRRLIDYSVIACVLFGIFTHNLSAQSETKKDWCGDVWKPGDRISAPKLTSDLIGPKTINFLHLKKDTGWGVFIDAEGNAKLLIKGNPLERDSLTLTDLEKDFYKLPNNNRTHFVLSDANNSFIYLFLKCNGERISQIRIQIDGASTPWSSVSK